jgi:hypothetical protein
MKNYSITFQSEMGGRINEVIVNITSVSFDGYDFVFWSNNKYIQSIGKEYLIDFHPVSGK